MKNDRKMFILIETILAVLALIVASLMMWDKLRSDQDKISVIVRNSDDTQWSAFKYGLRMAAEDHGVEMFVVSTSATMTAEEEEQMIESEIDNGADAVIVQPVPGEESEEMLEKFRNRIPVMLVECATAETEFSGLPVVEPDNHEMGATLAEELLEDYNGNIKGKTLGILSETTDSPKVLEREHGFRNIAEAEGAEVVWAVAGNFSGETETPIGMLPQVDLVVALDDASLTAAGASVVENDLRGALVYGIGHSTEAVYYLDTGAAECIVVPDEFNIGYQSLTETAESLENFFRGMEDRTVSHTVLRKEELFTKENQEILFTMSQ